MRVAFLVLGLVLCLYGDVYYAKVEPYELRKIASNVSGTVLFTDENMLGKKLSQRPFVIIDAALDKEELKAVNTKIELYTRMLAGNEKVLGNLQRILELKKKNYDQIKTLKIRSKIDKDNEYFDLINSENAYINVQKEMDNIKVTIAELELRKQELLKSIRDKRVSAPGFVLYSLEVRPGSVVTPGTILASVADTSKAILTIYLNEEELENLDKKVIYIDNERTGYKVNRLVPIADAKNISKYKAQIIIDAPKIFSRLVKVELKGSQGE